MIDSEGVRIGYEVFGDGDPTILLMPTWTIIHSRFWKFQVPYLSRRYRVITYDGPGNGLSDRITDPTRYSIDSYAADAAAVLDDCGVSRAVVVGLSLGTAYALRLATLSPEVVAGVVLIGPSLPLTPPSPEWSAIAENFVKPYQADVEGLDKYNLSYWHDHYEDFVESFFSLCFSEPHSTKAIEDSMQWATGASPEILEAEARKRPTLGIEGAAWFEGVTCPVAVIHGTQDRIQPHSIGAEAARLSGGNLFSLEGSGHIPNVRDPVKVNFILRDFVESVAR